MNKEKIIEQINAILEKIDDEMVLQEIKSLINCIYKHHISGKWER